MLAKYLLTILGALVVLACSGCGPQTDHPPTTPSTPSTPSVLPTTGAVSPVEGAHYALESIEYEGEPAEWAGENSVQFWFTTDEGLPALADDAACNVLATRYSLDASSVGTLTRRSSSETLMGCPSVTEDDFITIRECRALGARFVVIGDRLLVAGGDCRIEATRIDAPTPP